MARGTSIRSWVHAGALAAAWDAGAASCRRARSDRYVEGGTIAVRVLPRCALAGDIALPALRRRSHTAAEPRPGFTPRRVSVVEHGFPPSGIPACRIHRRRASRVFRPRSWLRPSLRSPRARGRSRTAVRQRRASMTSIPPSQPKQRTRCCARRSCWIARIFRPGEIDGAARFNSRRAIAGFQASQGLTASGELDAATWAGARSRCRSPRWSATR